MIEVKHLSKRYGGVTAVSDLSFTAEKGGVCGFLGPNGAGKTTTMNIMAGALAASNGTVTIDGLDIFENSRAARRLIGYLPELPPVYPDMTPLEYLGFVARAKALPATAMDGEIARVSAAAGIGDVGERLIKNLSKGYRQRLGLAQALLGDPPVIILDEPTVGLDPKQIAEVRGLIRSLGREHTVILSSHILSEVQALCDKVIIISRGVLRACASPEELERAHGGTLEDVFLELTDQDAYEISSAPAGEPESGDGKESEGK